LICEGGFVKKFETHIFHLVALLNLGRNGSS
jgi:hypothetical protein